MNSYEQLNDKAIWIFREPRSGSTWFNTVLASYFNRPAVFLPLNTEKKDPDKRFTGDFEQYFENRDRTNDCKYVIGVHKFIAIKTMHYYVNPILFRTCRRNRTEQFLSSYIARNFTRTFNVITQEELDSLPKIEPHYVDPKLVLNYTGHKKQDDKLWEQYSSQYENETVYYEDLLTGWESKIVPVKLAMNTYPKIAKIQNDRPRKATLKLPYNKREIITNYDEIENIINQELGPQ